MLCIKIICAVIVLALQFSLLGCLGYSIYCLWHGIIPSGLLAAGIALVIAFCLDCAQVRKKDE